MNPKPLKDMTWDELVDDLTWAVIQSVIEGKVRNAVGHSLLVYAEWRKEKGLK